MIRYILFFSFASIYLSAFAQVSDSVNTEINLREVMITATRTWRQVDDLPVQTTLISQNRIQEYPLLNIDDILKTSANVFVNRSWGIFSKNAAVTMRGLESSDRTLVMVDGMPKNRLAGGSVNWHNINPDVVDRIEIIKGPASALYGNNAMGGVINIITKKPTSGVSGQAKLFYGTYNTFGGSVLVSGRKNLKNEKAFYWQISGNYRQGDGYIFELPEYLDETDAKTKLQEGGGDLKFGYEYSQSGTVEITYENYLENRYAGRQVYAPKGSYDDYLTNTIRINQSDSIAGGFWTNTFYFSAEKYYGQKESINDTREYKLLDSYTDRQDFGWTSNLNIRAHKNHLLTVGIDIKAGTLKNHELYRTSSDDIQATGNMAIVGVYMQDEMRLSSTQWRIILGLRADYSSFWNGWQQVTNPSKATGFSESFSEDFLETTWAAISPKAAIQYEITKKLQSYLSIGTGFKPAKLKDLCQSGKITKGFRLANPNLKPEYLVNFEWGFHYNANKIKLSGAVYHSLGYNFQYSIGTGDSVDTGGNSLKPVIFTDNVAEIAVTGAELSLDYLFTKNLIIRIRYSYNNSIITKYQPEKTNPEVNLSGKKMIEVPPQLFYAGISWQNEHLNLELNCNYIDSQWYDIENTIRINSWFLVNARVAYAFYKKYEVYLESQDLLDNRYIDRKGQLSPGRFIQGGINIHF
jgi:iron complex outermembrane receptor protein